MAGLLGVYGVYAPLVGFLTGAVASASKRRWM